MMAALTVVWIIRPRSHAVVLDLSILPLTDGTSWTHSLLELGPGPILFRRRRWQLVLAVFKGILSVIVAMLTIPIPHSLLILLSKIFSKWVALSI